MSEKSEFVNDDEKSAVHFTPHIGAFVLETLTLGMYGEPRHTLREYVQNSFDSIRAAQRTRYLHGRGEVSITLQPNQISILDNGLGVSAAQAWKTLTSVGASKKDRQRDAGFRGIGRLAGMAYCDELVFRTTFPDEAVVTTVIFDCKMLLESMDPDEGGDLELSSLLGHAIKTTRHEAPKMTNEHFFEVIMRGLENAPDFLTDAEKVKSYLAQTVPVDFQPDWPLKKRIESEYRAYFGESLETIDLFVIADDHRHQIYKPYGDRYRHAKGEMRLRSVELLPGEENRYWGWVGRLSESAAVTDWETRGLRVRVRNIQVDGTEIFESLFTEVKPSYSRFSSYYIGEIHIDPGQVVPNARRDGFEEKPEWLEIKSSLRETVCQPLAHDAYEASRQGQVDVNKLISDIDKLSERSGRLARSSRATYDQAVDLITAAKRLRRRAASSLKTVADLDETAVAEGEPQGQQFSALQEAVQSVESVETKAKMLIGRFLQEEERIEGLRARIRREVLAELLDVVNAFVEPGVYQKIRRKLLG
ncbi:MAG: ATP-binding protein [Boseongicola sp.]|nr:ATP-binding protein [Boseongicola sp.]